MFKITAWLLNVINDRDKNDEDEKTSETKGEEGRGGGGAAWQQNSANDGWQDGFVKEGGSGVCGHVEHLENSDAEEWNGLRGVVKAKQW